MAVTTPSSFSVFVRCPSSKSACIEARGCEEVGEVCQRGLAREGFDRLNAYSQVYISCGGRPLSPRATLEKAGVEALCTLHIHPNAAAISVRLSLRERVRGLPHRLQRHPESLADELDALRLALEDAVAPLERTHLDTEAVGSLGGVLEALASLSLLGSDPRLSDLSFAWLERSLTALKTQLSAALRLVPSQLVPAHACMLLALEGLLPLLLYKVQDTSNIHRERVVWAAKKMRSLASRCRSASLHARPPLTSAPLESQAGPDKLLFQLAFGLSRLVAGAADNVQFVASGLPASLRIIEEQRRELDAALQGISSLAEVLSCFSTAKGVRKCPGGAPPSLQHHSSWLQLKCHLFVPVANQVVRLCAQLHGVCEQFEHMAPDAEDPAAGGTAAPEVVAAQLGRASRWLAQLLCTAFACTEAIDVPGPPEEPGLLTAAGCYQHLAGATQAPIMQMVLQDVRGHRMLTRALLVSPELRDYIPTAAKMYHLECWSAGGASDDEDENCDDECGTLVVKRGQDLLESSYSELLPVRPAHLHNWDVAGLATCRGLTRLDANFSAQTIEPEMEQRLAQLSNLAHLRVAAEWRHVPPVIASLPLTKLCLHHMAFDWETLEQRLTGGFSREFTQLAPTLQELRLHYCNLCMLPAVCSMLTQLTCLECTVDGQSLGSLALPSWLTRLTNLQRLECQGGSLGSFPSRPLDLPRLEHLDIGFGHLGEGTSLLPQLTALTFGHGFYGHVNLDSLQGATRLRDLTVLADLERHGTIQLQHAEALDGLSALTGLSLLHVSGVLPPEGNYLSHLSALQVVTYDQATLPAGLTAATGLSQLYLDGANANNFSLAKMWERLQPLLQRWPMLQEVTLREDENCDAPDKMLVADLLQAMY